MPKLEFPLGDGDVRERPGTVPPFVLVKIDGMGEEGRAKAQLFEDGGLGLERTRGRGKTSQHRPSPDSPSPPPPPVHLPYRKHRTRARYEIDQLRAQLPSEHR